MSLIRELYDNDDLIRSFTGMQRAMNRILSDTFPPLTTNGPNGTNETRPRIDLVDRGDQYQVMIDLPGVPKERVHVQIAGQQLIVSGDYSSETEKRDEVKLIRERSSGRFRRAITLPETADLTKTSARFDNGVLTMTMPKNDTSANGRSIAIE